MGRPLRIGLLIDASPEFGRGVLAGITDYATEHGNWTFFHYERIITDAIPPQLRHWKPDGILALILTAKLAGSIKRIGLPTVDVSGTHRIDGVPVVGSNQDEIVQLAADHLLECGLKNFAYCGTPGIRFSDDRCTRFTDYLKKAGHEVDVFQRSESFHLMDVSPAEMKNRLRHSTLASWLHGLPKPVGLMASYDRRAQEVLNICSEASIAVPGEVAVIGVDNDELISRLCRPPLTSVQTNTHRIGYMAAETLDHMLAGEKAPAEKIKVRPLGVVIRQSTNVLAFADPEVVNAVRFIREHACSGIQLEDVQKEVHLSRSTLERRFIKVLGQGPKAEINRVQINHVMELLSTTDYSLETIARLSGFNYVESMFALFKKRTGRTPGEYRKEVRA
jgi:LacI family transcriptional regulator